MPIFSSRSYHMGPWLLDHSLHQPFETWMFGMNGYLEDDSEGVADLPISGFQWYRYTSFLDLPIYFAPEPYEHPLTGDVDILPQSFGALVSIDENVPDANYVVQLFDMSGKRVALQSVQKGTNRLDYSHLNTGVYLCVVSDQMGPLQTQKLFFE